MNTVLLLHKHNEFPKWAQSYDQKYSKLHQKYKQIIFSPQDAISNERATGQYIQY